MHLITPEPGLVLWTTVAFLILMGLLTKFAWKPILHALKVREETIEYSLREAEKARLEVVNIEKTKKQMLEQARSERDLLLKEAREIRNGIVEESKQAARIEAEKIVASARQQIASEKMAVIEDLKKQVAILSVDIAARILEKELEPSIKQQDLINQYLKEVHIN